MALRKRTTRRSRNLKRRRSQTRKNRRKTKGGKRRNKTRNRRKKRSLGKRKRTKVARGKRKTKKRKRRMRGGMDIITQQDKKNKAIQRAAKLRKSMKVTKMVTENFTELIKDHNLNKSIIIPLLIEQDWTAFELDFFLKLGFTPFEGGLVKGTAIVVKPGIIKENEEMFKKIYKLSYSQQAKNVFKAAKTQATKAKELKKALEEEKEAKKEAAAVKAAQEKVNSLRQQFKDAEKQVTEATITFNPKKEEVSVVMTEPNKLLKHLIPFYFKNNKKTIDAYFDFHFSEPKVERFDLSNFGPFIMYKFVTDTVFLIPNSKIDNSFTPLDKNKKQEENPFTIIEESKEGESKQTPAKETPAEETSKQGESKEFYLERNEEKSTLLETKLRLYKKDKEEFRPVKLPGDESKKITKITLHGEFDVKESTNIYEGGFGNTNINDGNYRAIELGFELTKSDMLENGKWKKDKFKLEEFKEKQENFKNSKLPQKIIKQNAKVVTMLLTGYRLKRDDKVVALWGLDDGGCSDFKIREIDNSEMDQLENILTTASVPSS